jgi:putative ABC transport system ATP-binding protein
MTLIHVAHLTKIYNIGTTETKAVSDVSFNIEKGEFVAIMGPSGSGKSTLMHMIGALDTPTSGIYILDGEDVSKLTDDKLAEIRNKKIGFVFQAFNLLPRTTSLKNVMLPLVYANIPKEKRMEIARKYLEMVGLSNRIFHKTSELSGGQQQRVAIARGLVMNPALLLADEPTGNLASTQGEEVMEIFKDLNNRQGHTIVMITHEPNIASNAKRIITMKDGKILSDKKNRK